MATIEELQKVYEKAAAERADADKRAEAARNDAQKKTRAARQAQQREAYQKKRLTESYLKKMGACFLEDFKLAQKEQYTKYLLFWWNNFINYGFSKEDLEFLGLTPPESEGGAECPAGTPPPPATAPATNPESGGGAECPAGTPPATDVGAGAEPQTSKTESA